MAFQTVLTSKNVLRAVKIKHYKTLLRPVQLPIAQKYGFWHEQMSKKNLMEYLMMYAMIVTINIMEVSISFIRTFLQLHASNIFKFEL